MMDFKEDSPFSKKYFPRERERERRERAGCVSDYWLRLAQLSVIAISLSQTSGQATKVELESSTQSQGKTLIFHVFFFPKGPQAKNKGRILGPAVLEPKCLHRARMKG